MNIKESQLRAEVKQIVREAIEEKKYQTILSEVSPPGAKSERMIQHVKKSLRASHPKWSEDKITSVAIATAWKSHDKDKKEESVNERSSENKGTDAGKLVKAIIARGISDPDKIQQLASQWNVKHVGKPIDLGTLNQIIQRELGNPEGEIAENSEEENPQWIRDFFEKIPEKDLKFIQDLMDKHGLTLSQAVKDYIQMYGHEKGQGSAIKMSPRPNELEEASYKVVSPNQVDTSKENKALTIQTEPEVNESDDKWIQKAVNPSHKGYCTPMSKSTCTPRRKALAMRFKKGDIHHDNEMKEAVEEAKKWIQKAVDQSHKGACTPMSKSTCTPHRKALAKRFKHGLEEKGEEQVDETAYKVQGRSYKTFEDSPKGDTNYKDDPENT